MLVGRRMWRRKRRLLLLQRAKERPRSLAMRARPPDLKRPGMGRTHRRGWGRGRGHQQMRELVQAVRRLMSMPVLTWVLQTRCTRDGVALCTLK